MNTPQTRSFWAFVLSAVIVVAASFLAYPRWEKSGSEAVLSWDVAGYYHYLPAVFIYRDLRQVRFSDSIQQKYQPASSFYSAYRDTLSGNMVMKYSAGQAVMFTPAFLVAHAVAAPLGFAADGYSRPYQLAIQLWSVLFGLFGLWVLRGVLLRLGFADFAVAITVVLYALATNYFNYVAFDGAMTHGYLFTIYALLMAASLRFYERPTVAKSLAIGALVGLAILTRPTEILAALIPIFWGVPSWRNLRESRLPFLVKHLNLLLLAVVATVAVASVQLFYWHYVTGRWLVYSYGDQSFSWLHPHLWDGLMSYRKGWLVYTPVMFLAMFGFAALRRQRKDLFPMALMFTTLFIYVTFAWDVWTYGGGLGQRSMVQAMPVLALPFTSVVYFLCQKNTFTRIGLAIFAILCVYLNLWWTYQAHGGGSFDGDSVSGAYFWRVLGRYNLPQTTKKLLDNRYDFEGERHDLKAIFQHDFEQDTGSNIETMKAITGKQSLFLDKNHVFSPLFNLPITVQTLREHRWLRASAKFQFDDKEWETWKMMQFIVSFRQDDKSVRDCMLRPARFVEAGAAQVQFLDAKIPTKPFNRVVISFWNVESDKKIVIDDLTVELFNE